jgi:hypothetical protein
MTRKSLSRTLWWIYFLLFLVIALSLFSKFADDVPGLPAAVISAANKLYEVLRDMSLLIATAGVAYITSVFQRRSNFVESLEEAWRGIVATKSALYAYCEKPYPTSDDYIAAFCRISETIDTMRIVYRNVGETDALVGLYPYAPLHDMRRALQSVDPRKRSNISQEERKLVRDAILQSFYALRENFLEELDLEQPVHPLLISAGRRLKRPGSTPKARRQQERQRARQDGKAAERSPVDALLVRLYEEEMGKTPG